MAKEIEEVKPFNNSKHHQAHTKGQMKGSKCWCPVCRTTNECTDYFVGREPRNGIIVMDCNGVQHRRREDIGTEVKPNVAAAQEGSEECESLKQTA